MTYYFSKKLDIGFEEAIERVAAEMKEQGFGILTDIDVSNTFRKKLGVEFGKYRILGACNPHYAHKALTAEDKIGLMLPCNIVVQELTDGSVQVSTVDPIASMQAIDNPALGDVASEVREKLRKVIESL